MGKTREDILLLYRQISDRLMSASIEADRAADPGMGSVDKRAIHEQIARMQQTFREAQYAVPDEAGWKTCNVVFFGETNAGKSTLIEALRLSYEAGRWLLEAEWGTTIGNGKADFTPKPICYDVRLGSCTLRLTDLPGIEGVLEGKEQEFAVGVENALRSANVILYLVGNGKKPERGTLEKLKSYLRKDAQVYAVCNVHCKGKAQRDPAIDGLYTDELMMRMEEVQRAAAAQVSAALKGVLGDTYRGVYAMNAQLAFAAAAHDERRGCSLINPDRTDLLGSQETYAREFAQDYRAMRSASRLEMIRALLQDWAEHFVGRCYDQQLRKIGRLIEELTARGEECAGALAVLSELHAQMEREYRAFDSARAEAGSAQQVFARAIAEIPQKVASKYRTRYQEAMYRAVEKEWGGSISEKHVKQFMQKNELEMQKFIAEETQKKIDDALSVLRETYERLSEEIRRVERRGLGRTEWMRFTGSAFRDEKIDWAKLALKGVNIALLVKLFSGIRYGGPIGIAVVAAFEGIKYFMGADERTAKAKAAAKDFFAKQEETVAKFLREKLAASGIEGQIRAETYDRFTGMADQHARATQEIGVIVKDLRHFFRVDEGQR